MKKLKYLFTALLLLAVAVGSVGCSREMTPYQKNDAAGYSVSVKFDANGGQFTTNTKVIVDSYNLSAIPAGADGKVHIPLIAPDNEQRTDKFSAERPGKYFLAGWYQERQEHTDDQGNAYYTYSGKWDFENDTLDLDPAGTYSAENPVLTLYAVWVPAFQVEYYDRATGELLLAEDVDYLLGNSLALPAWNEKTGELKMNDFPQVEGKTFVAAYYDAEGTRMITGETLQHTGVVDETTGLATGQTMKLYLDYAEGSYFHIYTAKQFLDHCKGSNKLILQADLDFADARWNLTNAKFTGTIEGNGHTMANIHSTYSNAKTRSAGIFGSLEEGAVITDVTFESLTFTLEKGPITPGTTLGLLAGSIHENARLSGVTIRGGCIQVDSGAYFDNPDYSLGLICGMGDSSAITASDLSAKIVGDEPDKLILTVDGDMVTVVMKE